MLGLTIFGRDPHVQQCGASPAPRTACGVTQNRSSANLRVRVVVFMIVLAAVVVLVLAGYDPIGAAGIVAAAGIAAAEITARLLGTPAAAVATTV
jgi:hypothetical protein